MSKGSKLFSGEAKFIMGMANIRQLPQLHMPEIVFAGRSNVGKSSLINRLVNRRGLCRTSNTPGRTREVNFFSIDDRLVLVDLPGYGYAKYSKSEIYKWHNVIDDYLQSSSPIAIISVLIDARHGIKDNDIDFIDYLEDLNLPYQLVFTKADKVKKSEVEKNVEKTLDKLANYMFLSPDYFVTSSKDKSGFNELRNKLIQLSCRD